MANISIESILNGPVVTDETRLVTGMVSSANADIATVDFATGGSAYLASTEWYPGKPLPAVGTFITALTLDDGFKPMLSVLDARLPQMVLEGLVPEMYDGRVRVMKVAREAGVRSKVAVAATVSGIDPVSATIGKSAARVKAAVQMLRGEVIDIIAWSSDRATFAANALAPVGVQEIIDGGKRYTAVVERHQASAAVGQGGINARLASMLVGREIVVKGA